MYSMISWHHPAPNKSLPLKKILTKISLEILVQITAIPHSQGTLAPFMVLGLCILYNVSYLP